jgi:hypothetical protein
MIERGFDVEQISENYLTLRPTFANVLLQMLMVWRPPRRLFDRWLAKVRAYGERQRSYKILIHMTRIPWFIQQAWRHLRHGEFTTITGYSGYLLWKSGALRLLRMIYVRGKVTQRGETTYG